MNWTSPRGYSWRSALTNKVSQVHVKLALLSVSGQALSVALGTHTPGRLPNVAPSSGHALDQVARTELARLVGEVDAYQEQLYTFSFDRGTSSDIVVSYLALAASAPPLPDDSAWLPLTDAFAALGNPDQLVLEYALVRLRAKIGYTTIAFHLMPESFSLSDLQQTYEAILSRQLDPRNFRRRMVSSGLLKSENRLRREGSHRPAALYRFAGNHDPVSFLTPGAGQLTELGTSLTNRGTK